ncbi:MAG: SsgA family sporulation/cell division regulator [Nocardioidaceae bacterium]
MSVTRALTLELIDATGTATELQAELSYDNRDPYAVSAAFLTTDTMVRWVFARELLAQGLYEPTGDGDVHVWPCLDARGTAVTIIELSSPDGEALLQAHSREVSEFLQRTEGLVASGTESDLVDLDAALAHLIGE